MSSLSSDIDVLDGLTVKSTARGEPFTTSCDSSGMVTLEADHRRACLYKTLDEFEDALLSGELYVPNDEEWRSALEAMGCWTP